jgi:glycine/D-amino acid oxidase-like deaminating enzyme
MEVETIICGGGIVGACIAYNLTLRGVKPVLIERVSPGAAASGKAGGFLARGWGDGPTEQLHTKSFDLHEQLAKQLGIKSYRKIQTLQVQAGLKSGAIQASWLDGKCSSEMMDSETAQVTPLEFTEAVLDAALANGATYRKGTVEGIELDESACAGKQPVKRVVGVRVDGAVIPCKRVVIAMGPWSVLAEEWLGVGE